VQALRGPSRLSFSRRRARGRRLPRASAEEKMRPATVLVHVYDINSGHFVVMSASGSRGVALS